MSTGARHDRPLGGERRFTAGQRLLVQGGGTQVPVDASGSNDTERFETERPLDLCGHISYVSSGEAPDRTGRVGSKSTRRFQHRRRRKPFRSIVIAVAMTRLPRRAETADPTGGVRPVLSKESEIAGAIKALVLSGQRDAARERFGDLVARQQRRAVRIAYQYLRDVHDGDEAVQDAFVKVFTHITSYREDLPFEVWFTRILVNACLDLRKSRSRRLRWALPMSSSPDSPLLDPATPEPTPEP